MIDLFCEKWYVVLQAALRFWFQSTALLWAASKVCTCIVCWWRGRRFHTAASYAEALWEVRSKSARCCSSLSHALLRKVHPVYLMQRTGKERRRWSRHRGLEMLQRIYQESNRFGSSLYICSYVFPEGVVQRQLLGHVHRRRSPSLAGVDLKSLLERPVLPVGFLS